MEPKVLDTLTIRGDLEFSSLAKEEDILRKGSKALTSINGPTTFTLNVSIICSTFTVLSLVKLGEYPALLIKRPISLVMSCKKLDLLT